MVEWPITLQNYSRANADWKTRPPERLLDNCFSIMVLKRRRHSDHITCKHCREDFRAITVLHLRNIHDYEGDHPINDYKRKFGLQSATCSKSRRKISASKAAFWAKRGQHWTRASVLAEIIRIHDAGRPVRRRRVPVRLYEAGRRLFGTWQAAVEKAGLDFEEATGVLRWSQQKVVQAIQSLAKSGVALNASCIARRHATLFNVAVNRFPRSWAKALQAAGFDPNENKARRGKWNQQKAEVWSRKRISKGRSILARDVPPDLVDFVHKRLKTSWVDFVESLGVPYPGIKKRRDWTKEKLLEEIRRRKAQGQRLNYRAVASEHQALIHQARKFFGSWHRARSAAKV